MKRYVIAGMLVVGSPHLAQAAGHANAAVAHVVTWGVGISITTPTGLTRSWEETYSAGSVQVQGTGSGSFSGSSWVNASTAKPSGPAASVAGVLTFGTASSVSNASGTRSHAITRTAAFVQGTGSASGGSSVFATTSAWPTP